MPPSNDQIRAAAGIAVQKLIQDTGTNALPWNVISEGFMVNGEKIHFASKALGIFKPKELNDDAPLSIKHVRPSRPGRTAPYNDGVNGEGIFVYKLQGDGKPSHHNRLIEEAMDRRVPLILFQGLADGKYETTYPVYVDGLSYVTGEAYIIFDQPGQKRGEQSNIVAEPLHAAYGVSVRKTRLHQQAFRKLVLGAYGLRCALTNLPLVDLLEAAHIVPDSEGGEASVRNGIAMSTFHHTAYEADLLGIDPDGKIHLSDRITAVRDGPMYDHGLLRLEGLNMRFPLYEEHRPNRDFLAMKFERFHQAQAGW